MIFYKKLNVKNFNLIRDELVRATVINIDKNESEEDDELLFQKRILVGYIFSCQDIS
jgi:hypothetical protein